MNSPLAKLLLIGLIGLALAMAGVAIWSLPVHAEGLEPAVTAALPESGVTHPVTAVLLNFRGYDTLLEVMVLATALWAALAVGRTRLEQAAPEPENPLLQALVGSLVPVLILAAGYILWIGSSKPGGAFQAAAMLAAGGILLELTNHHPLQSLSATWERVLVAAGPMVFVAAAWLGTAQGAILTYPAGQAKGWILAIEIACTLSIGLILLTLTLGGSLHSETSVRGESPG